MNISRDTISGDFNDLYKQMGERDKDEFSRVCNKLLNNNFIYGQIKEDKNDYLTIIRFKDEISKYFTLIDYTLEQDTNYKIFFLQSKTGKDRIRLRLMESVLLLLFRKFYYVKGKAVGSSVNIIITFDELIDEINKTHIFKNTLNKGDLESSLKLLKRYKIIDFNSINFNENDAFEIYPTILHVVTNMDIKMIGDKLKSYKNSTDEEETYEIDED
jgi:hypothetical protein